MATIYDLTNEDANSPYFGDKYYQETGENEGRAGMWHVYENGTRVFVPDATTAPVAVTSSAPQPSTPGPVAAPTTPTQVSTGGVPGVPTIQQNDQAGNPREGEDYTTEQGDGGVWHVYTDGQKIFVPNNSTPAGATDSSTSSTTPTVNYDKPVETTGGGLTNLPEAGSTASTGSATASSGWDNKPVWAQTGGTDSSASTGSSPSEIGSGVSEASKDVETAASTNTSVTGGTSAEPSVVSSSEQPSSGGSGTYTVQHGDTLDGIAAVHGMSIGQVLELNPQFKENPDLIYSGQVVKLAAETNSIGSGVTAGTDSSFPQTSTYANTGGTAAPASTVHGEGWPPVGEEVDPAIKALEDAGKTESDPFKIKPNSEGQVH